MRILLMILFVFSIPCHANYLIGAGISDVTGPAAEVNMIGYAKLDQFSSGIHLRLRSRAFIFYDTETKNRVVFVSVDSGHIFQSVKQGVIRELQNKYGNLYSDENVMISATHTHSGPGGYSHEILYNITTLGFDSQNYQAIVEGIVNSISNAHNKLTPAHVFINKSDIFGLSFNRSISAYENNAVEEKSLYSVPYNPKMTLLKILDDSSQEMGLINWFALHGVSMSNKNTLISGDNKGYASYLFEKEKGVDYLNSPNFVAAFAQSNEGDVSPNNPNIARVENDHVRTQRTGQSQYLKAKELYDSACEKLEGPILFRHAYVDFSNIEVQTGAQINRTGEPSLGYSFAAGTKDGEGAPYFHEGMITNNPFIDAITGIVSTPTETLKQIQSPKAILLPLGSAKPISWVTSILPIQIFKIGALAIVGVPAEFTTMSGRRLENTIKSVLGESVKNIVIAGLANSYSGYVTTPEEYKIQNYEGGFTLFGSQTLPAYQKVFKQLAYDLIQNQYSFSKIKPADLSSMQISFMPGVIFDDVPLTSQFGEVVTQPKDSYKHLETVVVKFWGGHPKNNLRLNDTFLLVEKKVGSNWVKVSDDGDWSTVYQWNRVGLSYSQITIFWTIPTNITPGEYRIRHFGDYKYGWNGKIYPYEGVSKTFKVSR